MVTSTRMSLPLVISVPVLLSWPWYWWKAEHSTQWFMTWVTRRYSFFTSSRIAKEGNTPHHTPQQNQVSHSKASQRPQWLLKRRHHLLMMVSPWISEWEKNWMKTRQTLCMTCNHWIYAFHLGTAHILLNTLYYLSKQVLQNSWRKQAHLPDKNKIYSSTLCARKSSQLTSTWQNTWWYTVGDDLPAKSTSTLPEAHTISKTQGQVCLWYQLSVHRTWVYGCLQTSLCSLQTCQKGASVETFCHDSTFYFSW